MAASTAKIDLTAVVTSIVATVDLVANGRVVGTVDVPVDVAHERRSFGGQVINVHHEGLKDVDLDGLRERVEKQALSKYSGRP